MLTVFAVPALSAGTVGLLGPGPQARLMAYGVCLLISPLLSLGIGAWANKKINGVTGDVLGFTIEASHLLLALVIPATAAVLNRLPL